MLQTIIKQPLAAILAHVSVAFSLLYLYSYRIADEEVLGLGEGTATYRPRVDNFPIHITEARYTDSMKMGWERMGSKELTLWFGNSQLHGVNQYKQGQKNCVEYCFYFLSPFNKTVLGISYPNANFKELLLSIVYQHSRFTDVKRMVLPVFYDDMREDNIRETLFTDDVTRFIQTDAAAEYFTPVKQLAALKSPVATQVPALVSSQKKEAETAPDNTIQAKTENWLEQGLARHSGLWKSRPGMRANIFYDLYNTRNFLLGINSGTERKMIPGIFQENYQAFEQILSYCRDKNIKLVLYIPPIRPDVKLPYDLDEYVAFKKTVKQKAKDSHCIFLNLENLVPAKWWSQHYSKNAAPDADIDFMHFQEPGHKLLGDTMAQILKN